jgi:hypothetical protein
MNPTWHDWERGHVSGYPPDDSLATVSPTANRGLHRQSVTEIWLGGVLVDQDQLSSPLRFGLLELLVAVTVAGLLLGLFRTLGIFGALVGFILAVLFTIAVPPRLLCMSAGRQTLLFDVVWGIVFPLVCLVFDPFVFKYGQGDLLHLHPLVGGGTSASLGQLAGFQLYPWSLACYALLGCQMLALTAWLLGGRMSGEIAAVWSGLLWVGFALSAFLGVLLLVPAALGLLLFGIGALGFTPLFTARAYYRRAILAGAVATRQLPVERCGRLALAGYYAALLIPAIVATAGWAAWRAAH